MKAEITLKRKEMSKFIRHLIDCIEHHEDEPCFARCCNANRGALMFKKKGNDYLYDYCIADANEIRITDIKSIRYVTCSGKGIYEIYPSGKIFFEGRRNSFGRTEIFNIDSMLLTVHWYGNMASIKDIVVYSSDPERKIGLAKMKPL